MAFKLRSGFLKAGGFKQMGATPAPSPVKKTYSEAWDAMDQAAKDKYDNKADFVEQSKEWNRRKYGTTDPSERAKKLDMSKTELEETMKVKKLDAPEAKPIENLAEKPKLETREVKPAELTKKQERRKNREDKKMARKGARQDRKDARQARKAAKDTGKGFGEAAAAGVAATAGAAAGKAVGEAGKAAKDKTQKVDPKTMKPGEITTKGGKTTVKYTKKSDADAPGAGGTKKTQYTTPASETKAGKAAADRAALAETRKKQTKRQAIREAKKSADYDTTSRQERKNIRDEAAAMSGEAYGTSKRDLKKAQREAKKAAKQTKKTGGASTNKGVDSPIGTMSIDPKTPMAKKASPNKIYNKPKGKRTKY